MRISEARKFVNGLLDVGATHAADALSHALDVVVAAKTWQSASLGSATESNALDEIDNAVDYFEDD
jgi:hypothetical protein